MITEMGNIIYVDRLKRLNRYSLERRRVKIDDEILMVSKQDRTGSNGSKLEKCSSNKEIDRNWFANRVVDDWNKLSYEVVSAESKASFKRRLDKVMDGDARWS